MGLIGMSVGVHGCECGGVSVGCMGVSVEGAWM